MSNCCGGLTIERFRQIIQYNPYHFYQLANNTTLKLASECNTLVHEYAWQAADAVGRDEIRRAIDTAVERLTDYLDYSPYPRYFDEVHSLKQNAFYGRGCAVVRLDTGKVLDFGVEAFELLDTPAITATVTDEFNGVRTQWRLEFDGTTFDLTNAYAYPAQGDLPILNRVNQEDSTPQCKYLIPLVRWVLDNGDPQNPLVQVYGEAIGRGVKPVLYENPTLAGTVQLDPNTITNFVSQPSVYRRYTNSNGVTTPTAAVLFEFDTPCGCDGCGCNGAAYPYTRLGQAKQYDARTGTVVVYPATYNAETETWTASEFCGCHLPDRVRIRYYAGDTSDCRWDEIVTRLAAAELARPICACQSANRELYHWQFDLARSAGANDEMYVLSPGALDNPFGTRRGHVYAWERVKRLSLVRGIAL